MMTTECINSYPPPPQTPPPVAVKPWGCHNKYWRAGYWASSHTFTDGKGRRVQQSVWIPDTASVECQYRKSEPDDPRCKGCTSP